MSIVHIYGGEGGFKKNGFLYTRTHFFKKITNGFVQKKKKNELYYIIFTLLYAAYPRNTLYGLSYLIDIEFISRNFLVLYII